MHGILRNVRRIVQDFPHQSPPCGGDSFPPGKPWVLPHQDGNLEFDERCGIGFVGADIIRPCRKFLTKLKQI